MVKKRTRLERLRSAGVDDLNDELCHSCREHLTTSPRTTRRISWGCMGVVEEEDICDLDDRKEREWHEKEVEF